MRPLTIVIALSVTISLSGCTLLSSLPGLVPDPPPAGDIGSCLDGLNGADSDRHSVVDCSEPHLFQVTSIDQWPGMEDAIAAADGDLGAVWDDIHLVNGRSEASAAYGMWASRNCNEAAQRTVGIADVEADGHTAGDLWLRIGGTYNIDLSLASREDFVGNNDLSTYCSLAWYDHSGAPRLVSAPSFDRLVHPGFDADMRECWAVDYSSASCAKPHAAQVMLEFDGLEAFGPEVIARTAVGDATEEDWAAADSFCEQLLAQTLPSTADFGELGYLAEAGSSYSWDEFDGTVDPDGAYFYACIAAAPVPGDLITGDVFEGTAAVDASGSAV